MSAQEAAVSLLQKVLCDVGIDWAADTHAVCVMDANVLASPPEGWIRAQFMIGHADDPAVAHPDLETGGQDVGQQDRGLVGHTVGHTVGQLVQGVLGEGPRTSSAWVPTMRWPRIQPMPEALSWSRQCTGSRRRQ